MDTYRAGTIDSCVYIFVCSLSTANSLLRLALDGRISMFFVPPQFTKQKGMIIIINVGVLTFYVEYWEAHPEVSKIKTLQEKGMVSKKEIVQSLSDSDSDEIPSEPPVRKNLFDALLTLNDDVSASDDS